MRVQQGGPVFLVGGNVGAPGKLSMATVPPPTVLGSERWGWAGIPNVAGFEFFFFFFLAQTKMSWRSLLTSQYSR